MQSKNKTHADVIADMRQRAAVALRQDADAVVHHNAVGEMLSALADEAEAAHKREIAAKDGERKGLLKANESLANDNTRLRGELAAKDSERLTIVANYENVIAAKDTELAELTAIVNTECRKCGECAKFGKDCMAGDIDGAEDHRACEKFVSRKEAEIADLRRRFKVAEDALERCASDRYCNHQCACQDALAVVREEGGAK